MKNKYKKLFFLEKSPYLNTEFLAFNIDKCIQEQSILANLNIRKALNYSINKYEMIKYLRKNMVFPANSGIVPDFLSKYDFNAFSYNLDSANNLLKIDNQLYPSVVLFPNTLLYLYFAIPIKAKYFVIGYGLLELFSGLSNNPQDNVAHFAHLGGMLFGLLIFAYWKLKNEYY